MASYFMKRMVFPKMTSMNSSLTTKMAFSSSARNAFAATSFGRRLAIGSFAAFSAAGCAVLYALEKHVVHAGELELHAPTYPWNHKGFFNSYDHMSIRRGYTVYKQVCAACHSLKYLAYRNLVGVCFTEDEAKAEAAEALVTDGPNDKGKMFQRPGKLSDYFVDPYDNEQAARAANNGALPPDLSYIVLARHGNENYIYSLLTGYQDPPGGIKLGEGQAYNPYFPGGAIGMAQVLYDELLDYDDGTPASAAQLAKDVTTFLSWAASPEHDTRQRLAIKAVMISPIIIGTLWYIYRFKFMLLKSRKVQYVVLPKLKNRFNVKE